MGKTHTVRFEPVGIEMEADEDETVLDAAFRQGIMLMHGCKEGQCSACKSFLLDGDVDLDKLLDVRAAGLRGGGGLDAAVPGARLLRPRGRAHQLRRGGPPRRHAAADGRRARDGGRGADPRHPRLCADACDDDEPLEFKPGQYVDIEIPGARRRAPLVLDGQPRRRGGRARVHDQALRGRAVLRPARRRDGIKAGDALEVTGPYGVFTLRDELAAAARVHRRRRRAWRRSCACCARWPRRASSARRPTTTARAPRPTSSTSTSSRSWRRELAGLHASSRPCPRRRRRRLGRRDRAHHRRRRAPRRTTSPRSTPTCAARRRWSTPPSRCSSAKGVPESHIYFDKFTTTEHQ